MHTAKALTATATLLALASAAHAGPRGYIPGGSAIGSNTTRQLSSLSLASTSTDSIRFSSPTGDTFEALSLVQDGTNAFFLDDAPNLFTFDATGEFAGSNLTYPLFPNPGFVDMAVFESATTLANGNILIQVETIAIDELGTPAPWVGVGMAGQGLNSWRFDVGFSDLVNLGLSPGQTIQVVDSGQFAFDGLFNQIGSNPLAQDLSTNLGVGGIAVFTNGGADIADVALVSMQLFWEVKLTSVPAPSGVALLGLGGMATLRRRKR